MAIERQASYPEDLKSCLLQRQGREEKWPGLNFRIENSAAVSDPAGPNWWVEETWVFRRKVVELRLSVLGNDGNSRGYRSYLLTSTNYLTS